MHLKIDVKIVLNDIQLHVNIMTLGLVHFKNKERTGSLFSNVVVGGPQ